jgi:hypothetical protein
MYITTEGVKSEKTMVGFSEPVSEGSKLTTYTGRYVKNNNASYRRIVVEEI